MALPVHDWVREFSTLTGVIPKTAERYAVTLQDAGLFPRPRQGSAAWRTRVEAPHLTNYLLALASPGYADVADTVARLRAMRFAGAPGETSYFAEAADFGELMDGLIEARSRGNAPAGGAGLFVPSLISVSAAPATALLLWLASDGSLERRNTYGERAEPAAVTRAVNLGHPVIELCARACSPEMAAA